MIIFAFGLMCAEAAIRILELGPKLNVVYLENLRPTDNTILQYEIRPGSPDGSGVISSDGLRDREFEHEKPANVFRIAVLGDSVTFGMWMPRADTYTKRLEKLLNDHASGDKRQFEVMNFGVTGYNTMQVAEVLRTRALAFDPDLIIYGYVLNDPQPFSIDLEAMHVVHDARASGEGVSLWRKMRSVLSRSRVFMLARLVPVLLNEPAYAAHVRGSGDDFLRELHEGETWDRVREAMIEISQLARSNRTVPVVVAVFPTAGIQTADEYPLANVHKIVVAEAEADSLYALDLSPAFFREKEADDATLFGDFLHPNARGHEVAAVAMARYLANAELIPPDSVDVAALLRDTGKLSYSP